MPRFPRLGLPRFFRATPPAPVPRTPPAPPPSAPELPDSVEDWAVGDIAECIVTGHWLTLGSGLWSPGPDQGDVARVIAVQIDSPFGAPLQMLSFSRFAPRSYHAACFRKIQPQADEAKRADAEFIAGLKPARIPSPVTSETRP